MRRKIIQIANSTQLVSLPRKWCLHHNLKKGDELEVEEQGSSLIVNTEKQAALPNIEVDVSGLDRTSILFYIRSLYKKGYNEIKVTFSNQMTKHHRTGKTMRVMEVIHDEVNRQPGMEIVNEKENFCEIKAISNADTSELDIVMRRVFILLQNACEDLINAAKNNDRVGIQAIKEKHDTLTRFISYCLRLINRNPKAQKSDYFLYHILTVLDKITDIINTSARDIEEYDKKIGTKTLNALMGIAKNLRLYYNLYYKYDPQLINELNENREKIRNQIQIDTKNMPVDEIQLLYNMQYITDLLRALTESRLAMQF